MLEPQPDWPVLDTFYVRRGDEKYVFTRSSQGITCADSAVSVQAFGRSFRATFPNGDACSFVAPRSTLDIHNGRAVNCVDMTPDGTEILTGDCDGSLFLTHIGTEPVPLPGPTADFGVEDCCVDPAHKLFFACGGDFRIYEFSATEYQFTARYDGHTSSVSRVQVRGDVLFSGARDRAIALWSIETKKRTSASQVMSSVNDFCFSDCGAIFAACDSGVFAVDEKTGKGAVSPPYSSDAVFNCVAARENDLTAGLENGVVVQWDVRNMQEPKAVWSWYDAPINGVVYNQDRLWCLTNDGTCACVDIGAKKATKILGTRSYAPLWDIAFRNEMTAWTADGEGILSFFEL